MDVRMFTVGPVQENCFLFRRDDSKEALIVDPGEEAPKLLGAIEELGLDLQAILLTHTHFDHVGAVAPIAKATGAPVYCPKLEVPILQDINAYTFPGYGPFEPYDPEETVAGGERLSIAGIDIDVLFQGSVGRTDLPGGDWPTLARSIESLLERYPDEQRVFPGHMGLTTLGRERATNPFLSELA
jgi:glyoxylase-like metal-dependent hydrolase (beta-lactamase superfamily II)